MKIHISLCYKFLFLAFLEGFFVMAIEMLGAKMLTPFYSGSVTSWSVILAIVMMGLAVGYFLGGLISTTRHATENTIWLLFLCVAIFISPMPWLAEKLMIAQISDNHIKALFITATAVMFIPVIITGAVSSLIIKLITVEVKGSGAAAGKVYGWSTIGGIFAIYLFGFFIIPEYGIRKPVAIIACCLSIAALLPLLKARMLYTALALIPVLMFSYHKERQITGREIEVLYNSSGLLGQLKVFRHPSTEPGKFIDRVVLLSDNITHTAINNTTKTSLLDYPHLISSLTAKYIKGNKCLVLGVAGGSVINELNRLNIEVDAVEIDERMINLAQAYFHPDLRYKSYLDDARHFLQNCSKKYDLIIFDVFLGEIPPSHVLTLETFKRLKNNLLPHGMVMINSNNYIIGDKGAANKAIFNTLQRSGFVTNMYTTGQTDSGNNMVFLCATSGLQENSSYNINNCCAAINITGQTIQLNQALLENNDSPVLTDDLPIFDLLNAELAYDWRKGSIDFFQKMFIEEQYELIN